MLPVLPSFRPVCAIAAMLVLTVSTRAVAQDTTRLSRTQIIEDVGQLADFVELTHPDPYIGGGKLAFQRTLHRLLRDLPDSGLTRSELLRRLEQFLAIVGDGHTRMQPLASSGGDDGVGLPVEFRVIARDPGTPEPALFVQAIAHSDRNWAGARVVAIAGVAMGELVERQRTLSPYENEFANLQNVARQLATLQGLRNLIPEWSGGDSVAVTLVPPRGTPTALRLARGSLPPVSSKRSTGAPVPESRGGVPAFTFLDERHSVALLRLDNTWAHREVFEPLLKLHRGGPPFDLSAASRLFEAYTGRTAPSDTAAIVNALPAASDIFSALVDSMRTASTRRLIVDLRNNSGGHSMMVNMLLYFLHGRQGWAEFFGNFHTIRRLTPDDLGGDSTRSFPARVGDYDFSAEFDAAIMTPQRAGSEGFWKQSTITFADVLERDDYAARYTPPEVVVLVGPQTFSGGFWVAASLRRMGATLVGVPAGQAGNAFANVKYVRLAHSGLMAGVSSRLFVMFPEKQGSYPALPVDVPLTYERWAETGFDANAEITLARDFRG
jgi:hypothetical protein